MVWKTLKSGTGTGWHEIDEEAGSGWVELVFESDAIDAGGACINRGGISGNGYTFIQKENPSNGNGTLTKLCLWCNTACTGIKIGSFYLISGTTYKCRDAESVANLGAGQTDNIVISLSIQTGDYLGIYWTTGNLERDSSGDGYYHINSDGCVIDSQNEYTFTSNRTLSCYGST